jgi:hypothetical protein
MTWDIMTEHEIGVSEVINSSVKRLGLMIVIISLLQLIITVLLFNQENMSYIFIITQNIALFGFSLSLTLLFFKSKLAQQSQGNEKKNMVFRVFLISQVIGFIIIVLYITTVPIPQPLYDEEGVSLFYGIVVLLTGVTILNTILYYLGVKSFRKWIWEKHNLEVSREVNIGNLLLIIGLCSYFIANLPLLDAAIKIEGYTYAIDPSVFIVHFMIGIALIFVGLGFFFIGMILEVIAGYKLLKIDI